MAVLFVLVGEEAPGESLALHLVAQVGIGDAEVERAIAGVQDFMEFFVSEVADSVEIVAEPLTGEGVHAGAVRHRAVELRQGFGLELAACLVRFWRSGLEVSVAPLELSEDAAGGGREPLKGERLVGCEPAALESLA